MATNECAYAIEQFKIRLDELGEKVENNAKNDTEENVEITQVWQKALAVWRKTMESLFNSTSVTDTALYEDCSYVFFDKIYTRLHFGKRLQKDGSLCYEVFYSCLDLLNVLVVDQHYLSNDDVCTLQNNSMGKYFYIVLFLCRMATNYVLFKDELVHDYRTFLKILKAYADKKVMDELSSSQKTFYTITAEILIFFWCMANRTILVPSLVLIDLPSSAVRWLANCSCLNADATEPLIRIIYNVARHDDGADEYNKLNAMEVVKEYQRRDEIVRNDTLSLCCSLAVAHLSTPEQLKQDQNSLNSFLNELLQLTMEAATKEDFTCAGVRYHVSHLVAVLAKLFVFDERTVDYILTNAKTDPPSNKISTMKLFADLLIVFSNMITSKDPLNQFTCIALYNIIWSISFQPDDQEALRENTPLIDTIKRLAMDERSHICDQYKPRAMQSIKKAADGILYNLHAETKYHTEKSSKTNTETIVTHQIFKPMKAPILQSKPLRYDKGKEADISMHDGLPLVMFSYAHKDDKFCYTILKEVEHMKDILRVWIDIQECAMGDLWEKIADAIEHADVILCFVSEYYHQSKSCRQELTYAVDDLQKPTIPILLGDFKPKGWLGIRKAGMKYIRFRNPNEPKQSEISDLMERIRAEISPGKNIIATSAAPSHYETAREPAPLKSAVRETFPTTVDLPPISEWTPSDIRRWFDQHGIMSELHDLFRFRSGTEMLDYAQTLVNNRDVQERTYSEIFTQKYQGQLLPPHEFNRFAKALQQLMKENSVVHSIVPQAKRSSTCAVF